MHLSFLASPNRAAGGPGSTGTGIGDTYAGTPTGTTYAFNPTPVAPTEGVTNVAPGSNIIVEVLPVSDQTNYNGNFFIYPDRNGMRQTGSTLLRQHNSSSDLTGGFGLLYVPVDGSQVEQIVPVRVSYEPGWTPAEAQDDPGRAIRLRLDPSPGGSVTAPLPTDRNVRLVLDKVLPGLAVGY